MIHTDTSVESSAVATLPNPLAPDKSTEGWPNWSLLVVDDEQGMRHFLVKTLAPRCHHVVSAGSAEEAALVPGAQVWRAAHLMDVVDRFRPLMLKIARLSDESVYLVARSGHHALCVHRESCAHAQPSGHVLPGKRRVLGISAVGVSILAHGPDHDLEVTYRHNVPHYEGVGATLSVIRGLIDATRARGFSEMTAFGPVGTSGVGCAVPISETTHVGISIAGPSPRMSPARRRELGQLLHSELQGMARPVHSVPLF